MQRPENSTRPHDNNYFTGPNPPPKLLYYHPLVYVT